jgi:hypothetical protein
MIDLWACWDLPRDLRRSTTVQSLLAAPALRRRYRIGPDLWRARLLLPVPERPRRLALGAWRYRIGAVGRPALERFYSTEFLPPLPGDLVLTRISRTVDRFRLVDETTMSFTHDRELAWLLPGVGPTYRRAEILVCRLPRFRCRPVVKASVHASDDSAPSLGGAKQPDRAAVRLTPGWGEAEQSGLRRAVFRLDFRRVSG